MSQEPESTIAIDVRFYLRFHTQYGESLWLLGTIPGLGDGDLSRALPMEYLNDELWTVSLPIENKSNYKENVQYKYYLRNKEGDWIGEWGHDRLIPFVKGINAIRVTDTWNHAGEFENVFYTAPFHKVLLKNKTGVQKKFSKKHTHVLKIKAPLLDKHEAICVTGAGSLFNDWDVENPILLLKEGDWWVAALDLKHEHFPLSYKYGVYNTKQQQFVGYEKGENRLLYVAPEVLPGVLHIIHDGFAHLPNNTWRGAGVAIPVFSLRSKSSFGVGEFTDIRLLVDWACKTGLKLVQLLPVNDTTATNTWVDSYPYAAISAFALHPLYINLTQVAGKAESVRMESLKKKQQQLNKLAEVDYEEVMRFKIAMLKELYEEIGKSCLSSEDYKFFFAENKHWLVPYAAFCYLREKNGTAVFSTWKSHSIYDAAEVEALSSGKRSVTAKAISFYYFVQYHLHIQLKEAADYAHKKGIVLKGDIPIGIYRNGCDAWVAPQLYNMEEQAGAPPDDFTPIGQNWEFPTYNWKQMQKDGFTWWRQRFEQMANYFDAFRIDHILGFFRIWSVPSHAVQGIMGHFVPCLPVHYVEFGENGIWFDEQRYCSPFITDPVLEDLAGDLAGHIKEHFLEPDENNGYRLLAAFATQRKVEAWFAEQDTTPDSERLQHILYELIANVILFKQEGSKGQEFHFRIAMDKTLSYRYLIPHVQEKLRHLYINYFYHRQDEFWKKEALQKLPQLKEATNMLICGEDLGMVPHSVPEVMQQLGILSLEIQRMPKDPQKAFFHPADAPYLSVITPSTHDMSTVRSWWEEDRGRTQQFYREVLEQWGDAPYFCESWLSRAIVMQHLHSPAMWSVFQLQDLLGMSDTLRRENPQEERINNPANSKHYWRYRMHLYLEDLIKEKEFNEELKGYITTADR